MKQLKIEPILMTDAIKELFKLLDNRAFFVGGAVRDLLNNRPVKDIDLATPLRPQEIIELLNKSNIRIIPTGIQHGTLTLILSDKSMVEITTFRTDVKTDGRHALVLFGTDMKEDALRRDFTINALYMDYQGNIFDLTNGLKDLKEKKLRFIGSANKRIKEDSLRILRYFRFYGQTEQKKQDLEAVKACRSEKKCLSKLSKERVFDEMFKILSQTNPYRSIHLMAKSGILKQIVKKYDLNALRHLLAKERRCGFYTSALFRLWILCKQNLPDWVLIKKLKKEANDLNAAFSLPLKTRHDEYQILYKYGQDIFLKTLIYKKKLSFAAVRFYQHLKAPVAPFTHQDVSDFFHVFGPELGQKFKECEDVWLQLNCPEKKDIVFQLISS